MNDAIYGLRQAAEVLGLTYSHLRTAMKRVPEEDRPIKRRIPKTGGAAYYWPNKDALVRWYTTIDGQAILGLAHAGEVLGVDGSIIKELIHELRRKGLPDFVPPLSSPYKDPSGKEKRAYVWDNVLALREWHNGVITVLGSQLPDDIAEELDQDVTLKVSRKTAKLLEKVWTCVSPYMAQKASKEEFADSILHGHLSKLSQKLEEQVGVIMHEDGPRIPKRGRPKRKPPFRTS